MTMTDQRRERISAVRAEQAIDAPKAMRDYRAAEQNIRDLTARLRAERAAREMQPASSETVADSKSGPKKRAASRR